jgi:hypothetical protein
MCAPAWAQFQPSYSAPQARELPPRGEWLPGSRSYLGLNLGRATTSISCPPTSPLCDDSRPAQLFAGTMIGNFWGVELGYLNTGPIVLATGSARAQGLNVSLVGKTQVGPSIRVFGKVGTTYGRTEALASTPGALRAGEQGFGLSMGGGLSFDVSPRLSATLAWDSTDFRLPGGARDPVRSTSLGLQYRY